MCLKGETWEFPGGLLVRILGFHYRGWGSIPGQGTEISQGKVYSQKSTKNKKKKGKLIITVLPYLFIV